MTTQTAIDQDQLTARYIRVREWHALTGMSIFQAYREIRRGNLRGVKVGGSVLIDYAEITDYFVRNGRRVDRAA